MHPNSVVLMMKMIAFIKEYQILHGTSPSQPEMAAAISRTDNVVRRLLLVAEARGLIRRRYGARRRIEVL